MYSLFTFSSPGAHTTFQCDYLNEAPPWNDQLKSLEGLNIFDGTNLTLISDVDRDK